MSLIVFLGETELLMSREIRDDNDKLNLLGGKRYRKSEDSLTVAWRQVDRETGGQLSDESRRRMRKPLLLHYASRSNFVLYFSEVEGKIWWGITTVRNSRVIEPILTWIFLVDSVERGCFSLIQFYFLYEYVLLCYSLIASLLHSLVVQFCSLNPQRSR